MSHGGTSRGKASSAGSSTVNVGMASIMLDRLCCRRRFTSLNLIITAIDAMKAVHSSTVLVWPVILSPMP